MALAYLRLGEQMNCIENHSTQACILPISCSGAPGQNRIAQRHRNLRADSTGFLSDREALWLLNVVFMTVGAYPDEIPAGFRIDSIAPESGAPIRTFQNVAMGLGINHDGLVGDASVEDFNNDSFLDIFATSYELDDRAKLYLNNGDIDNDGYLTELEVELICGVRGKQYFPSIGRVVGSGLSAGFPRYGMDVNRMWNLCSQSLKLWEASTAAIDNAPRQCAAESVR